MVLGGMQIHVIEELLTTYRTSCKIFNAANQWMDGTLKLQMNALYSNFVFYIKILINVFVLSLLLYRYYFF